MFDHFRKAPEIPDGLLLGDKAGLWSVIIPQESTNLVLNPSYELSLFGSASFASSETLTRDSSMQRFGGWSLKVVTSATAQRGMVLNNGGTGFALIAGMTYTVSVYARLVGGVPYRLYVSGPSSTTPGSLSITGRGAWRRYVLTFTPSQTGTHNVNFIKENSSSTAPWWLDGWLLEPLPYATTYFDGDTRGLDFDEWDYLTAGSKPNHYFWQGARHQSASTRLASTRSGGRVVSFRDLGLDVLGVIGGGLAPMQTQNATYAIRGSGAYQRTTQAIRLLTIAVAIYSAGLPGYAQAAARTQRAFNPERSGPVRLLYQRDPDFEPIALHATYLSGLEGSVTTTTGERTALQFEVYAPMINLSTSGGGLGYSQDLTVNYIAQRQRGAGWDNMAGGFGAAFGSAVENHGILYVGSEQIPDLRSFVYTWNGVAWVVLVTRTSDGPIRNMAPRPGGGVYFTAGTKLFEYNAAANTTTELTGMALNTINEIKLAPDGSLWIAGIDSTPRGAVRRRDAAGAWSTPITTNNGGSINDVLIVGGSVFIAGQFTTVTSSGGTIAASNLAEYSTATATLDTMGSGANDRMNALALSPYGGIVAAGRSTDIGGIFGKIAVWNGSAWNSLGNASTAITYEIITLTSTDDMIYAGGQATSATNGPDLLHKFKAGLWTPLDIDLPGTPGVRAVVERGSGDLVIGFTTTGTAKSAVSDVTNIGGAPARPIITFTGPGELYHVINHTNGQGVYFSGLTLLAGETVILGNGEFMSDVRGALYGYVQSGSTSIPRLVLEPGLNRVSALIGPSAVAGQTSATITYNPTFDSLLDQPS